MVKRIREKGQALVEYAVLIPPMLLISTSISAMFPQTGYGALCDLDQAFNGGMCTELVEQGEDPEVGNQNPEPGDIEPTLEPTPEPEICVDWAPTQGSSLCSQTQGCDELEGQDTGYYMAAEIIETFVIKAGQDYFVYESGITEDGCYDVHISGGSVSWWRVASGKNCKEISHLQVWQAPWCD